MNFLYEDLVYRHMRIHSEVRNGAYVLQLLKNGAVVMNQTFSDWGAYSRQYDMVRTMIEHRAQLGY